VIKPTIGEYNFRGEKQKFARLYFWETIKKVVPQVLNDLQQEPLNLFRNDFRFFSYSDINTKAILKDAVLHNEASNFRDSLKNWQGRWNLGIKPNAELDKLTFEAYFDSVYPTYKLRFEFNDEQFVQTFCHKFLDKAKIWSKNELNKFRSEMTQTDFLRYWFGNIHTPEEALRHLEKKRKSFDCKNDDWHRRQREKECEWVLEMAFDCVCHWHTNEKDRVEMFLQLGWASVSKDISPKFKGLELWRYMDEKKKYYIERQKQRVLHLLDENPLLAIASPDEKHSYAQSVEKKAELYCDEVEKEIQSLSPKTKRTDTHPNFERDMTLTIRMLCEKPFQSWETLAEISLRNKGRKYTKNISTLNKEIRALKESVKVMLEFLGLPKENIFRTQGRPKKST